MTLYIFKDVSLLPFTAACMTLFLIVTHVSVVIAHLWFVLSLVLGFLRQNKYLYTWLGIKAAAIKRKIITNYFANWLTV